MQGSQNATSTGRTARKRARAKGTPARLSTSWRHVRKAMRGVWRWDDLADRLEGGQCEPCSYLTSIVDVYFNVLSREERAKLESRAIRGPRLGEDERLAELGDELLRDAQAEEGAA